MTATQGIPNRPSKHEFRSKVFGIRNRDPITYRQGTLSVAKLDKNIITLLVERTKKKID